MLVGGTTLDWRCPAVGDLPARCSAGRPNAGSGLLGARRCLVDENVLGSPRACCQAVSGLCSRGVEDSWRLVRFADGAEITLRPETTRAVELHGGGPESVLTALGLVKPDDVELEYLSEDLGQGETETRHRYQWTDGSRSILAEQVKNEIFDGATPYSTYVRGVVIDGDGGVVLTGRDDSAVVTEA